MMRGDTKRILGCLGVILCLTACGQSRQAKPYGGVIAGLAAEEAYALLDMEYPEYVMVTSDMLYDEGEEPQASICCTVYYYVQGEPVRLGEIMSVGTAYPLRFSKDGIFAASGHSIEKYGISQEDGSLCLLRQVTVTYDKQGNEHYTAMIEGEEMPSTQQEYDLLAGEYAESRVIHFSCEAEDCINS